MNTTYEFVTAKGTKASIVTGFIHDLSRDGKEKETGVNGIVAVIVNGTKFDARSDKVNGMDGASFTFNGKAAFLPVPKEIFDEVCSEQNARIAKLSESMKQIDKIDRDLASFNRYMDNENN